MITVALFWIASNQEESKSLLWKGWINDLYTHAIEHCTAVRLSKPQVQTTVDETHKHDPDWEKLDTNAHTENQAWVKEMKQSRHSDSVVWETTYSPLLGAGGKWWRGAWGVFREAKFPFLDLNASYMGVLEHSCSCTLLTGVQFCVSYLNKKLKHNLDTAAFKALPGSLWQMPTAQSPFNYYFEGPHDGQMALSHTFPEGALLGSYY